MPQHRDITTGSQHIIHNWEVATDTERDALTLVSTDLYKVCFVVADSRYYTLIDVANKEWASLGGGGDVNVKKEAGEDISAYSVCVIINNLVQLADSSNSLHASKPKYIALTDALLGEIVNIQSEGEIENSGWGLTTDVPLFVGTLGSIVDVPPSTGFIQQIGMANTSDTLEIEISVAIRL